jgi:hypothetical protein
MLIENKESTRKGINCAEFFQCGDCGREFTNRDSAILHRDGSLLF